MIYIKKWSFEFRGNCSIKTVEKTISDTDASSDFQLLFQNQLDQRMQNGHNYLHVGLIQVVVKPLTRTELNTSILEKYMTHKLCQFHVGLVELFLSEWPIYFNCFLNFSITVSNLGVLKTLIMSVDTQGYDMESW